MSGDWLGNSGYRLGEYIHFVVERQYKWEGYFADWSTLNQGTFLAEFPSYTNIIVDAGLPEFVFQMALSDGEYYVRGTAFRCLQELIQIQAVWDIFMATDRFLVRIKNLWQSADTRITGNISGENCQRVWTWNWGSCAQGSRNVDFENLQVSTFSCGNPTKVNNINV